MKKTDKRKSKQDKIMGIDEVALIRLVWEWCLFLGLTIFFAIVIVIPPISASSLMVGVFFMGTWFALQSSKLVRVIGLTLISIIYVPTIFSCAASLSPMKVAFAGVNLCLFSAYLLIALNIRRPRWLTGPPQQREEGT